jgi:hypothetical protein
MVRDEAGPARAHLSKEGFRVGVYPYSRPAQGRFAEPDAESGCCRVWFTDHLPAKGGLVGLMIDAIKCGHPTNGVGGAFFRTCEQTANWLRGYDA